MFLNFSESVFDDSLQLKNLDFRDLSLNFLSKMSYKSSSQHFLYGWIEGCLLFLGNFFHFFYVDPLFVYNIDENRSNFFLFFSLRILYMKYFFFPKNFYRSFSMLSAIHSFICYFWKFSSSNALAVL